VAIDLVASTVVVRYERPDGTALTGLAEADGTELAVVETAVVDTLGNPVPHVRVVVALDLLPSVDYALAMSDMANEGDEEKMRKGRDTISEAYRTYEPILFDKDSKDGFSTQFGSNQIGAIGRALGQGAKTLVDALCEEGNNAASCNCTPCN
jgi:hypothetical protein